MRHCALISLTALSLQAMSLNETISYALEHNNVLQQANISVERSKTLRDSKQGQRFGRVDILASYDHYNNPRTLEPLTPISIAVKCTRLIHDFSGETFRKNSSRERA